MPLVGPASPSSLDKASGSCQNTEASELNTHSRYKDEDEEDEDAPEAMPCVQQSEASSAEVTTVRPNSRT